MGHLSEPLLETPFAPTAVNVMITFACCEQLSLEKGPSKAADESLRETEPLCKFFPVCAFSFSQESELVAVRSLISRLHYQQLS